MGPEAMHPLASPTTSRERPSFWRAAATAFAVALGAVAFAMVAAAALTVALVGAGAAAITLLVRGARRRRPSAVLEARRTADGWTAEPAR